MARIAPDQLLVPSLIDRLTDPASGGSRGQAGYTADQMAAAVRRDLEDLLNTRQAIEGIPPEFKEVLSSVLAYGLPDLVSVEADTPQQRDELARVLEASIARFEPRLRDIRATLLEGDERLRTLRFRVDARLCLDPAPEVAFDTYLELSTGRYSVRQSGG